MNTHYENFVFEMDFQVRKNIIVPQIVEFFIKTKKKEINFLQNLARFEKKKELNFRELLEKFINKSIDDCDFNMLMYKEKDSTGSVTRFRKSRLILLFYMIYLTELNDRKYVYDIIQINKKMIPKPQTQILYDDMFYKFYNLRLPYTREEQDKFHIRQEMEPLDYFDDIREAQKRFTRRDLTEEELKINPCDLFIKYTPKAIYNRV